jgi:hypothetical protein
MLECRAVPCLVSDGATDRLLERARNSERVVQCFDRISGTAEMARITGSYVAKVGAEEVKIVARGPYIWVRLTTEGNATDLLFTQRPRPRNVPMSSRALGHCSATSRHDCHRCLFLGILVKLNRDYQRRPD